MVLYWTVCQKIKTANCKFKLVYFRYSQTEVMSEERGLFLTVFGLKRSLRLRDKKLKERRKQRREDLAKIRKETRREINDIKKAFEKIPIWYQLKKSKAGEYIRNQSGETRFLFYDKGSGYRPLLWPRKTWKV